MKERILNIETVHQCNCCLGCKTLHPLVSVIDLSKSNLEQQIIKFDFYTILMMEGEIDDILYSTMIIPMHHWYSSRRENLSK